MNQSNSPLALGWVMIDCPDAAALAAFYARLLGGQAKSEVMEGCAEVTAPGLPLPLCFQQAKNYRPPVWPAGPDDQQTMLHLDFVAQDREAAIAFALSLGATLPDYQCCQPHWEVQWVTLLDPAGHPFCFCDPLPGCG